MHEGLLWYDADKKSRLSVKIANAAARYQAKFGHRPTVCYVNPADVDGAPANGIELRAAPNILKNHLWIGVESQPNYKQGELL